MKEILVRNKILPQKCDFLLEFKFLFTNKVFAERSNFCSKNAFLPKDKIRNTNCASKYFFGKFFWSKIIFCLKHKSSSRIFGQKYAIFGQIDNYTHNIGLVSKSWSNRFHIYVEILSPNKNIYKYSVNFMTHNSFDFCIYILIKIPQIFVAHLANKSPKTG